MKKKRSILSYGAILIYLLICTVAYLNWIQKNKARSGFIEIESELYNMASVNSPYFLDSLIIFEKQVNEYTLSNPVPEDIALENCVSATDTSSISMKELRSDLIVRIENIRDFYRKSERKSNNIMFLCIIFGNVGLWIMRYYIRKLVH